MRERSRIGVILRYAGIASIITGIILIPVLLNRPYVVEKSETLTLEDNQDRIFVEVQYSGRAEHLTATISASPPPWPSYYSLSLHNQSQMDHFIATGEFQDGLFGHTINQTATYDADIEGEGTCYLVFGRGNSSDSIVISADLAYSVSGVNPYFAAPGIVMLVVGVALVVVGFIAGPVMKYPSINDMKKW